MQFESVKSYQELKQKINQGVQYLFLYKEGSALSACALENLKTVRSDLESMTIFIADVNQVRDIHGQYGIKTVPVLVELKDNLPKNYLKGCLTPDHYKAYLDKTVRNNMPLDPEKPAKSVVVYSTPTCPWCTTVKNFLNKHRVRYTEVNVASDESAAKEMVRKSGQQGVPQTEISGQMVIGFDQSKLKKLLELN